MIVAGDKALNGVRFVTAVWKHIMQYSKTRRVIVPPNNNATLKTAANNPETTLNDKMASNDPICVATNPVVNA